MAGWHRSYIYTTDHVLGWNNILEVDPWYTRFTFQSLGEPINCICKAKLSLGFTFLGMLSQINSA